MLLQVTDNGELKPHWHVTWCKRGMLGIATHKNGDKYLVKFNHRDKRWIKETELEF